MRRLLTAMATWLALPTAALAQDGVDPEAFLNLHVMAADFSGSFCEAFEFEGQDCSLMSHAPVQGQTFIFFVTNNVDGWAGDGGVGNGIAALQFGIEYSGLDVLSWTLCTGDLELPQSDEDGTWPESGTGNAVTWPGGCYQPGGENVSVGVFLVSDAASGTMTPTVDPRDGEATYTDCDVFTWEILSFAPLDLEDPGSEPDCFFFGPTERVSWGAIKASF